MAKSGIAHVLTFLISLVTGHAVLLLLQAYVPPLYGFCLRFGKAIAMVFKITYDSRIMAALMVATILSYFIGILLHKLLKVTR
jgi:uncharacterized membrane protein